MRLEVSEQCTLLIEFVLVFLLWVVVLRFGVLSTAALIVPLHMLVERYLDLHTLSL